MIGALVAESGIAINQFREIQSDLEDAFLTVTSTDSGANSEIKVGESNSDGNDVPESNVAAENAN